jgi:hypothetical protein
MPLGTAGAFVLSTIVNIGEPTEGGLVASEYFPARIPSVMLSKRRRLNVKFRKERWTR